MSFITTILFHVAIFAKSVSEKDLQGVNKPQSLKQSTKRLEVLENVYKNNPCPSTKFMKELSKDFRIESFKVFQWFRTKRHRERLRRKLLWVLFSGEMLHA